MDNTLMSPKEWASAVFSETELGDIRRTKRLVKVAGGVAENPCGTLPGAFSQWAELKAAYRLLDNDKVTYQDILAPHLDSTRAACQRPGEYLLIEDTTELDFTGRAVGEQMGRIGNDGGRGLFAHTTLAVRVEGWNTQEEPEVTVVGLFDQKCWVRQDTTRCSREKKADRLRRRRESERWAAVFGKSAKRGPSARWTYIADRESDIYEAFERCRANSIEYVIRASQPRALAEQGGSVFQAVAKSPVLGRFSVHLRARPGQRARTAKLELRSCSVTLRPPWRPDGKLEAFELNVVEAREVNAPRGVSAIHWVLLTSWACEQFKQAMRVVKTYARRWLIEEYHKALKTGTKAQESQLRTRGGIEALLGLLAVVAVRLLQTKLLGATKPDEPLAPGEICPEALAVLEATFGKPSGGWTHSTALVAIARLGGFLARKSDGNPGWITLWRGMQKLMLLVRGFELATGGKCG